MRVAFIGDIVGKPGRKVIKQYVPILRKEFNINFVIANYENASHGFGLTIKNYKELSNYIDVLTGGNHTFDKKDIYSILENKNILRPLNIFDDVGKGYGIYDVKDEKLAIISLMGIFSMPYGKNPFLEVEKIVDDLLEQNIKNIFIDFHAEATAEKRAMFLFLREKISALIGTHTHISTDDLIIDNDKLYLTDIGLTGCYDNVIGMDYKAPLNRFLKGKNDRFDVIEDCKNILQMVIFKLKEGKVLEAFKLKVIDSNKIITNAIKI